jgi:hypothetical protein
MSRKKDHQFNSSNRIENILYKTPSKESGTLLMQKLGVPKPINIRRYDDSSSSEDDASPQGQSAQKDRISGICYGSSAKKADAAKDNYQSQPVGILKNSNRKMTFLERQILKQRI